MKIFKVLSIAFCLLIGNNEVHAQYDTIRQHLLNINAFYDSAEAVAFDVKFNYEGDSLLGNYQYRESQGSFVMNKKKFYYKLDFTECIQSDSFMLTILKPEQVIMISQPTAFGAGYVVPIREKIDSLLSTDFGIYSYSINKTDSINRINFYTSDSLADYKKFSLHYDPVSFAIMQYEVSFDYYPESDSSELGELIRPGAGLPRELTLRVYFSNYRIETLSDEIFNLDNYIKADGMEAWRGVGKYADFAVRFFN